MNYTTSLGFAGEDENFTVNTTGSTEEFKIGDTVIVKEVPAYNDWHEAPPISEGQIFTVLDAIPDFTVTYVQGIKLDIPGIGIEIIEARYYYCNSLFSLHTKAQQIETPQDVIATSEEVPDKFLVGEQVFCIGEEYPSLQGISRTIVKVVEDKIYADCFIFRSKDCITLGEYLSTYRAVGRFVIGDKVLFSPVGYGSFGNMQVERQGSVFTIQGFWQGSLVSVLDSNMKVYWCSQQHFLETTYSINSTGDVRNLEEDSTIPNYLYLNTERDPAHVEFNIPKTSEPFIEAQQNITQKVNVENRLQWLVYNSNTGVMHSYSDALEAENVAVDTSRNFPEQEIFLSVVVKKYGSWGD